MACAIISAYGPIPVQSLPATPVRMATFFGSFNRGCGFVLGIVAGLVIAAIILGLILIDGHWCINDWCINF